MVRFELLLPLYYNDGRPIEKEKFLQTDEELVAQFGATSTDSVIVSGRWMYQSTLYEDKLIRVRVDVEDVPANWDFFRSYKETLKQRFEQEDIWITAYRIEVV
ncbi:MAG TPA: hypothetical protein EYP85_00750 [Armatimonadetes bacterium]|nr:hypothetical protein [Armatimonadota bacterium]